MDEATESYMKRRCRRCGEKLPPFGAPGRPRAVCKTCRPPTAGYQPHGIKLGDVDPDWSHEGELTLGPRGQRLHDQFWPALQRPDLRMHQELLTEACRMVDRLDRMERMLRGDTRTWASLKIQPDSDYDGAPLEINVTISHVAVEARQTANAVKMLVTELRTAIGSKGADTGDDELGELITLPSLKAVQ